LTFRLYDDPATGNLLYSEDDSVTADKNGIYIVTIGENGTPYGHVGGNFGVLNWLNVTIDGGPETHIAYPYPSGGYPRIQLTSVPYALRADSVNHPGNVLTTTGPDSIVSADPTKPALLIENSAGGSSLGVSTIKAGARSSNTSATGQDTIDLQVGMNDGGSASLAAPPALKVGDVINAGTFLHELGMSLSLHHGGANLNSVMSYNYQYGEVGCFDATATGALTAVNSKISIIDSTGKAYGFTTTGDVVIGGNVNIGGTLTKSTGSFKIDHPLDPANKYLYHSFVESPDMMNIYNGNATLDGGGEAIVQLPDYFEALNKDFRYQLSCIGSYAPVYIAAKVSNNQFKIAGGRPGMEISWQVTGIRQDAYAKAHPIQVEVEKEAEAKGKYLSPKEHGMPEAMGIGWDKASGCGPRLKGQPVNAERNK
jgi:hypothetical protein